MARTNPKKDVVIVGLGWAGSIMGMELALEGLDILALERGPDQDTVPDFQYPQIADELKYGIRRKLIQQPAQSTLTIRRTPAERALPYRVLGGFSPGNGVGGAGAHWNGNTWRPQAEELRLYSYTKERFGAQIIPEDMLLQDYPVTYEELEPHFERFERVVGIAGQTGNLRGNIIPGGNPFEAPRQNDYPMPPIPHTYDAALFAQAAEAAGYHPFPRPGANASQTYVNPYGQQLAPCNFCGFCELYGCYQYAKGSPQTCILDALKRKSNFAYRTHAEVLRVEMAADGKTATGVTYIDHQNAEEVFQPADVVLLCAWQLQNTYLMLVSGIGQSYDPSTGEGVIGRAYAYQMMGGVSLFFRDKTFNPFIGSGVNSMVMDDFGVNQIDFAREGFIGGSYIYSGTSNGQPLRSMRLPPGVPAWGGAWKTAIRQWYGHSMAIGSHGSCMSYRGNYLDLDPTYKDQYGRPLLRMTFNWHPNEIRMTQFMRRKIEPLAQALAPDIMSSGFNGEGAMYDVRPTSTTHNVGGTVMGNDPRTSALNRYLQTHGVHNLFVIGAGAYLQNIQYNPTGLLGGLAYWAAHALRTDYLRQPRILA